MNTCTAVLRTPYHDAQSALALFLSMKKAEGLAPATVANYQNTIGPMLREYPEFLKEPRRAVLEYIAASGTDWTRATRIKILRTFSAFLVDEGLLPESPMKGIKNAAPPKRADIPTVEGVRAFIDTLDTGRYSELRLRTMLLLALDTGLRRGELCALRVSDLDESALLLNVRPETTKTRRGRVVPVSPQVLREIKRFIALRPSEWKTDLMFPTETGRRLTPAALGQQVRRLSDKAGARLKVHGLRHLCATEFLRESGNIALVARLLGHSSISITSRFYEHLDVDDLQAAHGKAAVVAGVLENRRVRKV